MLKPTYSLAPKKIHAARALAEREIAETMQQVADRACVSRRTLYRYLDDPEFCQLMKDLTDAALVRYQPQIDRVMVRKALGGSVAAARYLAQRGGRFKHGYRDKGFDDFLKRLDESDRRELKYYEAHGVWPDEDGSAEVN